MPHCASLPACRAFRMAAACKVAPLSASPIVLRTLAHESFKPLGLDRPGSLDHRILSAGEAAPSDLVKAIRPALLLSLHYK